VPGPSIVEQLSNRYQQVRPGSLISGANAPPVRQSAQNSGRFLRASAAAGVFDPPVRLFCRSPGVV